MVRLICSTRPIHFIISDFIKLTMDGGTAYQNYSWIPSLDISFVSYIDGLSLLFSLLITGIGALVVLYSIFYLDKNRGKAE